MHLQGVLSPPRSFWVSVRARGQGVDPTSGRHTGTQGPSRHLLGSTVPARESFTTMSMATHVGHLVSGPRSPHGRVATSAPVGSVETAEPCMDVMTLVWQCRCPSRGASLPRLSWPGSVSAIGGLSGFHGRRVAFLDCLGTNVHLATPSHPIRRDSLSGTCPGLLCPSFSLRDDLGVSRSVDSQQCRALQPSRSDRPFSP